MEYIRITSKIFLYQTSFVLSFISLQSSTDGLSHFPDLLEENKNAIMLEIGKYTELFITTGLPDQIAEERFKNFKDFFSNRGISDVYFALKHFSEPNLDSSRKTAHETLFVLGCIHFLEKQAKKEIPENNILSKLSAEKKIMEHVFSSPLHTLALFLIAENKPNAIESIIYKKMCLLVTKKQKKDSKLVRHKLLDLFIKTNLENLFNQPSQFTEQQSEGGQQDPEMDELRAAVCLLEKKGALTAEAILEKRMIDLLQTE
jgi:hypothetical protein